VEVQVTSVTGSDPVRAEKRRLRAEFRAARRAYDRARHDALAEALLAHARGDRELGRAPLVLGYVAHDGEPDIALVLEHLRRRGARILLPRVGALGLELVRVTPSAAAVANPRTGVRELSGSAVRMDALPPGGVVLVPCVATDRRGARLGRGGGHYDRLLPLLRARGWRSVGVAHAAHVLESLPVEGHDALLDRVLSERGWLDVADLPAPRDVAGIVLAGGRSLRFGRAKAAAEVAGVPMLERVVAVLASCCDEVVVVAAPDDAARDVLALARAHDSGVPVRLLHDARAHAGPAAALAGALPSVACELAFVSGCDTPLLAPALVRGLVGAAAASPATDVVAPDRGKGLEPLLAVYRVATMAAVLASATRSGPIRLVDALTAARHLRVAGDELAALDPDGASFLNVNQPADLDEVERRLAAAAAEPSPWDLLRRAGEEG
jgi:5-formyltetrahydrofolate cyclo-ligase